MKFKIMQVYFTYLYSDKKQAGAIFAELAVILLFALMIVSAFPATGMHRVTPSLDQAISDSTAVGAIITTHWLELDGRLGTITVPAFTVSANKARAKLLLSGYAGTNLCYYACDRIGSPGVVSCPVNEATGSCVALNPAGRTACETEVARVAVATPVGNRPYSCLYTGDQKVYAALSNTRLRGVP